MLSETIKLKNDANAPEEVEFRIDIAFADYFVFDL